MGQVIDVSARPIGDILIVATDRSLTGQDGLTFEGPPEPDSPPAELAARLFDGISGVDHVHVLSNTVSIRGMEGWEPELVAAAEEIVSSLFVFYRATDENAELRDRYYNATISHIRAHNDELWILRVKPDDPPAHFMPGQYATLAFGYWEPRADGVMEEFTEGQHERLARRPYSVSSSIVDSAGELVEAQPEEIEFYIVKVPPGREEIPALTPRLFLKDVGDRIHFGGQFKGHYSLDGISPFDNLVFLSTGTGEAPHNSMTAELLRRGHEGAIFSSVTVRYQADLGYEWEHAALEARWPNYTYHPLTTREAKNEGRKIYVQDLIASGDLEEEMGAPLDPGNTHVFLCGNPAMIGLPKWTDNGMQFPETLGVCQMLHERGFTIDRGHERGNVHYEEYWRGR